MSHALRQMSANRLYEDLQLRQRRLINWPLAMKNTSQNGGSLNHLTVAIIIGFKRTTTLNPPAFLCPNQCNKLHGLPNAPSLSSSPLNNVFVERWSPWRAYRSQKLFLGRRRLRVRWFASGQIVSKNKTHCFA